MAALKLSQSQRTVQNMNQGEKERITNDVVKFLLVMDQKKYPIKKADINKHVLKEHSKAFPIIIAEATKKLSQVFGIELKELENKHKGSYILVNKLDGDGEHCYLKWSEEEDSKRGLLMIILSVIFMEGNEMTDNQVWSFLTKLGIEPDKPHEVFGDCKKMINQEWVRQCYLEITRVPNVDPPLSQFSWGQRAFLETSKRKMLNFVSKIYGIEDLSQWTSQWKDVLTSESGDNNEQASSTQNALRA